MKAEEFYNETEYEKSFTKLTSTGISDNFENVFDFAERYAQQRVNEVLDKASKNVNEFKTNKSEDDFEKGWNSCIECINKTKSILKLKNNEK